MPLPSTQVALLLALLVTPGLHAGSTAGADRASVQVNVRVLIAPVVRLLENRFPRQLDAAPQGTHTAAQRLLVSTNLHNGFCLNLLTDSPAPNGWRVRSIGGDPVQIDRSGHGWRVCGQRRGLHTLLLEHEFDAPDAGAWPVRTELTLL